MRRALLVLVALSGCAQGEPDEARPVLPSPDAVRAELAGLDARAFFDASFSILLARSPEAVLELGLADEIPIGRSFIDDRSEAFEVETDAIRAAILERLGELSLEGEDRVSGEAYRFYLEGERARHEHRDLEVRIAPGFQSVPTAIEFFFTDIHPLETPDDAADYVKRLARVAPELAELERRMDDVARRGRGQARLLIDAALPYLEALAEAAPEDTSYHYVLAERLPRALPDAADRAELLASAAAEIEATVQPAYASLVGFLKGLRTRVPAGAGIGRLPGGDLAYRAALRRHVTKDVSPDELHALGQRELARIHAELAVRLSALGEDPSDLPRALRAAYGKAGTVAAANVVGEYERIIRDAEVRALEVFDAMPRAPVRVIGGASGGFYVGPSLDGTRPGAFYAEARGPESRLTMRTLAYHEAIPGHHLQIGLQQELELPRFRRIVGFTGYAEGWALYAEALAGRLGWYADDPWGDVGRLQFEAYRAVRLVVDTGLHARGMTFDQAVAEMVAATGFSREGAEIEIVRYASWPGQATAYLTGKLEIERLRDELSAELGAAFEPRAFHRAVLGHGSLPLALLAEVVRADLGR